MLERKYVKEESTLAPHYYQEEVRKEDDGKMLDWPRSKNPYLTFS